MTEPTNIVRLRQADDVDDPLTEVLRAGARQLLAQAIELEAAAFLAARDELRLPDGRPRLVRHGHGPERQIQTGIGPVPGARVKVRDRGAGSDSERVRFSSAILPRWARRTESLDALLPVLYLRGISTGDFQEALAALLGKDAPNLSPAVVSRLTAEWQAEYERWQTRDLSARHYVYIWADGVSAMLSVEVESISALTRRSCPTAWCSFAGLVTAISGVGRIDQAARAGNVTAGLSLNWATLSSVI